MGYSLSPFTDEETEAERSTGSCLRAHSWPEVEMGLVALLSSSFLPHYLRRAVLLLTPISPCSSCPLLETNLPNLRGMKQQPFYCAPEDQGFRQDRVGPGSLCWGPAGKTMPGAGAAGTGGSLLRWLLQLQVCLVAGRFHESL